ncbi:cyclopropane fatty acyl phospholipid synthase [Gramella jeungdoensis]|uniref:Cyclopropane fatty acyl phospholipid synthase n=1 Tax=Gramella jeungdoensis TaxID=708091 RepID=A0ABT0Z1L0_9FLAO|nr:cyclopropane fatty acyl phospholipid synthase [Gramella jeungdoensis]MCM8569275.1 cyclopropane fatty acyl phospholipid synthase [Gramella jeungdoensis]
MQNQYKKIIEDLLASAGIRINGNKNWDIRVFNERFYRRILRDGSMGLGESYMEGWWDCPRLDEFIHRIFEADLEKKIKNSFSIKWQILKARLFNMQSIKKARKSISRHYDIGNKLFREMLDPLMIYSCGYWQETNDLARAQEHKLELICQKLQLKPGQKVLDIGCGWGGFPYYAAKNYDVKVVGITISKEQQKIALERCEGLPVEIRLQDYREVNEEFDRIVSIGMLEHVGHKNHSSFMKTINHNLRNDGICLLHFIGGNETRYTTDAWINKYIFPQGLIPSITQIGQSLEKNMVLQDLHNFGLYYDKTLMAWHENFQRAWPRLKETYNNFFYKMWEFYLCSSAAAFRSQKLNLWQLVITKREFPHIYQSVRPQNLSIKDFING